MGKYLSRSYKPTLPGKLRMLDDLNHTNPSHRLTQDWIGRLGNEARFYSAERAEQINRLKNILKGRKVENLGPNMRNLRVQKLERPLSDRFEKAIGGQLAERDQDRIAPRTKSIRTQTGPGATATQHYIDSKNDLLDLAKRLHDMQNEVAVFSWENPEGDTYSHVFVNRAFDFDPSKNRWSGEPKWVSPTQEAAKYILNLPEVSPMERCESDRFDPNASRQTTFDWCKRALHPQGGFGR